MGWRNQLDENHVLTAFQAAIWRRHTCPFWVWAHSVWQVWLVCSSPWCVFEVSAYPERFRKEETLLPQPQLRSIKVCPRIFWVAFHVNKQNKEHLLNRVETDGGSSRKTTKSDIYLTSYTQMNSRCIKDSHVKKKKSYFKWERHFVIQYSVPIKENINEINFQFLKILYRKTHHK